MKTRINGTDFTIDDFDRGQWFWSTDKDESSDTFDSSAAALQNAIDYVKTRLIGKEAEELQRIEDEVFGTYEQQVAKDYEKKIRG